MTDDELRTLLKALGGKPRGKMKRETMLARIAELQAKSGRKVMIQSRTLDADAPGQILGNSGDFKPLKMDPSTIALDQVLGLSGVIPEVKVAERVTPEAVLEAVKGNIARGMDAQFDKWGWVFTRKGRTDSGTLAQPLSNIVKCANAVCIEVPKARPDGDPARYA